MGEVIKEPEPKTFEQYLAVAPLNVLACRTLQHSWNEDGGKVDSSGGSYVWELPCSRCGTVKVRTISARGKLLSTTYKYPAGYQLHAGGRMDKDDLAQIRLMVVKEYA